MKLATVKATADASAEIDQGAYGTAPSAWLASPATKVPATKEVAALMRFILNP